METPGKLGGWTINQIIEAREMQRRDEADFKELQRWAALGVGETTARKMMARGIPRSAVELLLSPSVSAEEAMKMMDEWGLAEPDLPDEPDEGFAREITYIPLKPPDDPAWSGFHVEIVADQEAFERWLDGVLTEPPMESEG